MKPARSRRVRIKFRDLGMRIKKVDQLVQPEKVRPAIPFLFRTLFIVLSWYYIPHVDTLLLRRPNLTGLLIRSQRSFG